MKKGISLIVLIITIIVITILAGAIIINFVNNSLITKSKEATFKANIDTYKSELTFAVSKKYLDDNSFDPSTFNARVWNGIEADIGETIKKYITSITAEDGTKFEIQYSKLVYVGNDEDERKYARDLNIKGLVTDWGKFFEGRDPINDKPNDQTNTTMIAYDMWGEPVNIDLWKFSVISSSLYGKTDTYCLNSNQAASSTGYKGITGQTVTEIIGEIPAVIYNTSTFSYKEVTSLYGTFYGCWALETVPAIPSSVTNMDYTFYNCSSLVEAPAIPNSVIRMACTFQNCSSLVEAPTISSNVTSLSSTFWNCSSLVEAPAIPSSVTVMGNTFQNCSSLVEAPKIPNSVTSMINTFCNCSSLVGVPAISNNVIIMDHTFYGCSSLATAPTIPSSVTTMSYTFDGCGGLVTAPTIPSSVTNMNYTFNGCSKLTGNLVINANAVSYYTNCLYGASTASGTSLTVSGSCPQLASIVATKSTNSNIQ